MSVLRLLIIALALAASADEAGAHASLVSSSPADGALLVGPPDHLALRFDESVQLLSIRVVDDTGTALALPGTPVSEGDTIRMALPPAMREGTYVLSFRVASADAHPVGGSLTFSIGRATTKAHDARTAAAIPELDGARIILRALRDMALLIAVGGALFCLFVARWPADRAVLVSAGMAAAVLSMASIALQGAAMTGNSEPIAMASWRAALQASFGLSGLVAVAGALTIAVGAMLRRGVWRNALLALGALASVVSLPLTGHAAIALPAALARPALTAHVLAAAFWSGSLIALFALLRSDSEQAIAAVRRFSRYALAAVALLVVAGAGFTALQLTSPADLLTTRYGNLILAKAALLAALLALAAHNRFRLTARLVLARQGAARVLRRSIAAEIVLIAMVIAVTAVLVQTQPRSAPIVKLLGAGSRMATLTVTPGHAGRNAVIVLFRDAEGRPFDPAEATLAIANPSVGLESMTRTLAREGSGRFSHDGGDFSFAGSWRLELRARIGDFEQIRWITEIDIR